MKNDFICYPVVIERDSKKGSYNAFFPDIDGCKAKGKTIQDTISNCKEVLGQYFLELDDNEIKNSSEPGGIELNKNQSIIYIDVNMKWFAEKNKYKSITKAVTLPIWLNQKAVESGINVSAVLQEALIEKLGDINN